MIEIKNYNYWLIYKESEYSDCMKAVPFETIEQLLLFTQTRPNLVIISASKTI